jgi:hypothetical protein
MGNAGEFDIAFTLCSDGQAADYAVAYGGGFICGSLTAQCPAASGTVSGFFVARDRSGGVSVLTGPRPDGSSEGMLAQQASQQLAQALAKTRASFSADPLAAEAQDVSTTTIGLANTLVGLTPSGGAPAPCLFAGPVDPSDGTLSGGFACGGTQAGKFALQQCP